MKLLFENWRGFINEIAIGQCYPHANKMANKWLDNHIDRSKPPGKGVHPDIDNKDKFKVVHGRITDKFSGESVEHAWVEMGDEVFDWQTSTTKPEGIPKEVYYDLFQPEVFVDYTAQEAITNCMKAGHHGPWNEASDFQARMKKQLPGELDFLIGKGGNNTKVGPGVKNPKKPKFKSAPPGTAPVGEAAGECQVITVLRLGGEDGLANRNAANVEGLQEYVESATDMEGGQFGGGNMADRNVYLYKVEVCGGFGDYKPVAGGTRDADTEAETPVGLKEFYGGDFQWFYFPQESEGKSWRIIEKVGVIKNFIDDPVWELYGSGKIKINKKPLLDLVKHKPKKNAFTKDEREYVPDEHEELPSVWKHPWEWDAGVIALKHYLDNVYDIKQTGT